MNAGSSAQQPSPPQQQTGSILARLTEVIESRRQQRPDGSYVVRLLDGGEPAITQKIREEAREVAEAAAELDKTGGEERDSNHLVHEVSDLVFHLLVALCWANRSFSDVEAELSRRFGIGGLEEKASRQEPNS